jgi:predicted aconitase with swiveling domain
MSKTIRIYGRVEWPGIVEAEAIVSPKPLEGFANVDTANGWTTERNHPLFKKSYADKVLVYPSARGSGGFLMYGYGAKAAAFLHTESCPLNVAAACAAHIPSMTDFDVDPCTVIESGDMVLVNADEGWVEVRKQLTVNS